MDSGFEVEVAALEEGSSGEDNRSGILCTNNSIILLCSALKEIFFSEVFSKVLAGDVLRNKV